MDGWGTRLEYVMFLLVQTPTSAELFSDLVVVVGGGGAGRMAVLSRLQLNVLKYPGIAEAVHVALQLTRPWVSVRN